jgi:diaminopimelate epimerase
MEFVKMHGLGNDFIVVKAASFEDAAAYKAVSASWCARRFGIGADGLLVTGPDSQADIFMRQVGLVDQDTFMVRTRAGNRRVALLADEAVRVDMGVPILKPALIPVEAEGSNLDIAVNACGECFKVNAVSMGNPHAVIFTADVSQVPLEQWGAQLEKHPLFPAATNVEFVQVKSSAEIVVRVWERGTGLTLACGTGACAAVVAACLQGHTGREVLVHLPGGQLFIEWSPKDEHVYMTGPVREVYQGFISEPMSCEPQRSDQP